MTITNAKVNQAALLAGMYSDGYFPNHLVDKVKGILLELCEQIEARKPQDEASLLELTHAATERINDLEEEFEEHDSELETGAREDMAESFEHIVRAYGFTEVDIEDVIAPREW